MIVVTSSKKNKGKLFNEILLLSKIREALMNDKTAKKICKEKDIKSWFLKGVPIKFEDMKQSAKTVDSHIILNRKLMSKPFNIIMRYVIHELAHSIQHVQSAKKKYKKDQDREYLDKDTEIEAFQYQIEFDSKNRGKDKAEEYVDGLLDYHKIRGRDRKSKKEELLGDS